MLTKNLTSFAFSFALYILWRVRRIANSVGFILFFANIIILLEYLLPAFSYLALGTFSKASLMSQAFYVLGSVISFFIMPLLLSFIWHDESCQQLGLKRPINGRKACYLIAFALIVLLPCGVYFASLPAFSGYALGERSFSHFMMMQFVFLPIYYFTEEFFFRGFLFLSLFKRINYHSFWVTDIIFMYAHLGKPLLEILLSAIASVIFNFLTLRTKSIYPAWIVHSTFGFILNVLVTYWASS